MKSTFNLEPARWYAWQMLPGYGERPYSSPIYVYNCEWIGDRLEIGFHNACYAEGVRNFRKTLQVLWHSQDMIVGRIDQNRFAVVTGMSMAWLKIRLPMIAEYIESDENLAGLDIQAQLSGLFEI